jgi:septum formation protein
VPERLAPLLLASRSPRRTELLAAAGYRHELVAGDVDETPLPGEAPRVTCLRLAEAKARAGAAGRAAGTVLGGDTLIELDGVALGKPDDEVHAREMLARLSGRTHAVVSAVALQRAPRGPLVSGLAVAEVAFAPLDAATLAGYLASREWEGKAGAYAIQGRAAAFARLVSGDLDTVVGLPLALVGQLLQLLDGQTR